MPAWLVIAEEESGAQRRVTVIRTVSGNRTREEALGELLRAARTYVPPSWKSKVRVVGRDFDGSFWVLPDSGGERGAASCRIRLVEQVHP
ncbi:hypothetical protein C0216_32480 (plasmid) [Streptomyces globosus]|uniref:Uncharacterized protein n=1 Tax=Streptomyces globosus TaxID=68209 RepID=A0A344UBD1_9ACTN|nr:MULTISPECIES: hypothetical protein [Streptomyces]AXE28202.1 hypothetical protein C0216_32480 [Streptomyces globosus]